MKLGPQILLLLGKTYDPETWIQGQVGRYDLAFMTDRIGRPIQLFLGKCGADGKIRGERFTRRIVADEDGNLIKDHWDNKGKTR